MIVGLQVAAYAFEAALSGSKFEIDNDANLRHDGPTTPPADATTDWADLADVQNNPNNLPAAQLPEKRAIDLLDKQSGGPGDDSFAGGTKEDTVCPGQTTGSIPKNKSDLLTFHAYTEPGTGTHPGFLNLAWSRVSDPSGTTLMDFELNQKRIPCDPGTGSPNVQRTVGDLLIEYAIDQGGARADIKARTWNGSAWSNPATDVDAPSAVCGNNRCAVGTINNTATLSESESDGLGNRAQRTFGEAQLDLRFLLQGNTGNTCTGFGSAMLKSRSSDQITPQLKDFIKPTDIDVNTCGTVTIIKHTDPRGVNAEFPFTSTMRASATDTQADPETCADFSLNDTGNAGPPVKDSAANTQTCTVLPGQYTVTEGNDATNFQLKTPNGVTCTASAGSSGSQDANVPKQANINVAPGGLVTCTYVNAQKIARLTSLQSFFPNDSVTISGTNLTFTNSSVTFKLYKGTLDQGETCGSTVQTDLVKYTQTVGSNDFTTAPNGTDKVAKTTNGDGALPEYEIEDGAASEGAYYWEIFYDGPAGGDPDVRSCVENSNVSIDNGTTFPAVYP